MALIKNYKNHNRYLLLDNFNHFGEVTPRRLLEEEAERDEEIFRQFLKNECGVNLSKDKFYDIFGCAYVSSGGYSLITLDTNAFVFIDEDTYMSYLAFDEENTYVVVCDIENEEEKFFIIG